MLPQLIIDLALILGLAAVTTLICRWLRQPVVLGYILAGYLASNHFGLLPDVEDTESLHTLAEMGIIFLLFGLGLEFSFKKLLNVGTVAITSAIIIIGGMMFVGFESGRLLGWNTTDSVFLAAMLSMSSTTIIIKALSDLGLKSKKFSTLVFGILIVEDLFAIIMLVILSTIYVGQQGAGGEVAWGIIKLLFFLVLWLGVGLYIVPLLLERAKRWLTREILLIVSLGMCLGMVVLANYVGFSSALGAFIMGSIFAETVEVKEIEKVTLPIRDLFGAVFFVSVGMMVNPEVLVDYWWPVMLLTVVVIVGQIVFGSIGMLVAGQRLETAIAGSFSLVQIGEFAFIIATLGVSLGVTSGFLYPVAVAVSVVTTFFTPFIMRAAPSAARFAARKLPSRILERFESNAKSNTITVTAVKGLWRQYITSYIYNILLFSVLLSGVIWLTTAYLFPAILSLSDSVWIRLIVASVGILIISPLLWGLAMHTVNPPVFSKLWKRRTLSRSLIILLYLLRGLLALAAIVVMLRGLYGIERSLILGLLLTTLIMIIFSRRITRMWRHLRKQLTYNLRDKNGINSLDSRLADLHITRAELSADSLFVGRTIGDLQLRQLYGVSVISIQRGSRTIIVPKSAEILMPQDIVSIVGSDEDLRLFMKFAQESLPEPPPAEMTIHQWWIRASNPIVGRDIGNSMIREVYGCLIVGLCRVDGSEEKINPRTEIRAGDIIWLAGERERIAELIDKYK